MHIDFVSDYFEDWYFYDILIPMVWMSCSHTIEFYFDVRKKYHPSCHDMVDTFLCCGGFFVAYRGCHSWRDDVVDTFPRHGYYIAFYLQYCAPHFWSRRSWFYFSANSEAAVPVFSLSAIFGATCSSPIRSRHNYPRAVFLFLSFYVLNSF